MRRRLLSCTLASTASWSRGSCSRLAPYSEAARACSVRMACCAESALAALACAAAADSSALALCCATCRSRDLHVGDYMSAGDDPSSSESLSLYRK